MTIPCLEGGVNCPFNLLTRDWLRESGAKEGWPGEAGVSGPVLGSSSESSAAQLHELASHLPRLGFLSVK